MRLFTLVVASILVVGFTFLSVQSQSARVSSDEPHTNADSFILIPTSIKQTRLQLEIAGKSLEVPVEYAIKENVSQKQGQVFVLPVWVVEKVERVVGRQRTNLSSPSDVLVPPGVTGLVQLDVTVRNLLDRPDTEKQVFEHLKRYLSEQLGLGQLGFRFEKPHIKEGDVRFVLVGRGRGEEREILLSNAVGSAGGLLGFDLDLAAVRRCEQIHGLSDGLPLATTTILATGPMKVRFERLELEAQFVYLRSAMAEFRKRVGSEVNPYGTPPDVVISMVPPGEAHVHNLLTKCYQQSLQIAISIRQGSTSPPLLPLLNKAKDTFFHSIKIDDLQDNQRITFLMENQVTITATLGELKRLDKLDENARSEALRKAIENYQATSRENQFAVSGGLQVGMLGATGKYEQSESHAEENRKREEEAQIRQQFNHLMRSFSGNVKFPTGLKISDDVNVMDVRQLGTDFSQKTFFFDYTLHRFAPIRLIGNTDIGSSVSDWMLKYAQLKAHHQVALARLEMALEKETKLRRELDQAAAQLQAAQQKLEELKQEVAAVVRAVGRPEQWAEAKARIERSEKLALQLEGRVTELQKAVSSSEADKLAMLRSRIKHLRMQVPLLVLKEDDEPVNSIAFSPDGKLLATGSDNGTARIYDASTGRAWGVCGTDEARVFAISFSPDGGRLAIGDSNGVVHLWDTLRRRNVGAFQAHEKAIYGVTFSPDGKQIATASGDKTARIWDAGTGREIVRLNGHRGEVMGVAYAPDQRAIVTASSDQTARIWDAATGRQIQVLRGHSNLVYTAQFSGGGNSVLTASADGTACIWNANTGQQQQILKGHRGWLFSAVFGPGSKLVATASRDKTVGLWDVMTGQEIRTLPAHSDWVYALAFSPDGSALATACRDGTVRVWAVDE